MNQYNLPDEERMLLILRDLGEKLFEFKIDPDFNYSHLFPYKFLVLNDEDKPILEIEEFMRLTELLHRNKDADKILANVCIYLALELAELTNMYENVLINSRFDQNIEVDNEITDNSQNKEVT